jgi:hypothetical protein
MVLCRMQESMEVEEEEEEEDDLEAMMRKYREKEEKESKPTAFLLVIYILYFVLTRRPNFLIFERSLYLFPYTTAAVTDRRSINK